MMMDSLVRVILRRAERCERVGRRERRLSVRGGRVGRGGGESEDTWMVVFALALESLIWVADCDEDFCFGGSRALTGRELRRVVKRAK
jgi:hypothetical protein